jgi:hypothetical protein
LKDPDRIPNMESDATVSEINRRKSSRTQHENEKFDEDYYMFVVMATSDIIVTGLTLWMRAKFKD